MVCCAIAGAQGSASGKAATSVASVFRIAVNTGFEKSVPKKCVMRSVDDVRHRDLGRHSTGLDRVSDAVAGRTGGWEGAGPGSVAARRRGLEMCEVPPPQA